jgi:hypothetical protein
MSSVLAFADASEPPAEVLCAPVAVAAAVAVVVAVAAAVAVVVVVAVVVAAAVAVVVAVAVAVAVAVVVVVAVAAAVALNAGPPAVLASLGALEGVQDASTSSAESSGPAGLCFVLQGKTR